MVCVVLSQTRKEVPLLLNAEEMLLWMHVCETKTQAEPVQAINHENKVDISNSQSYLQQIIPSKMPA